MMAVASAHNDPADHLVRALSEACSSLDRPNGTERTDLIPERK
jgi:hypothetical protein